MNEQTLYLKCRCGEVAPRVLLSGDPARVDRVAEVLEDAQLVARNREFSVVTGVYRGKPVSVVSGGIGSPSTAIALEELALLGVRAVVRIGTMMGVSAPLGAVVIPTGAARFEGTSARYLSLHYPAVPHWDLVWALAESARAAHLDVRLGLTATYDAFYPDMAPSLLGEGPIDLAKLQQAAVLSLDMESSLVFVVSALRDMAAAAMCLVTVQAEPHAHMAPDRRIVDDARLVKAALDGLVTFEVER